MTDNTDNTEEKRPLSLVRPGGRLELRKPLETGQVRQSFPHGRSKTVTVEVRKQRAVVPGFGDKVEPASSAQRETAPAGTAPSVAPPVRRAPVVMPRTLTAEERAGRVRALQDAKKADDEARRQAIVDVDRLREREARQAEEDALRRAEEDARRS